MYIIKSQLPLVRKRAAVGVFVSNNKQGNETDSSDLDHKGGNRLQNSASHFSFSQCHGWTEFQLCQTRGHAPLLHSTDPEIASPNVVSVHPFQRDDVGHCGY